MSTFKKIGLKIMLNLSQYNESLLNELEMIVRNKNRNNYRGVAKFDCIWLKPSRFYRELILPKNSPFSLIFLLFFTAHLKPTGKFLLLTPQCTD